MRQTNKKLSKNLFWNTLGSSLYASTSLFLLIAVTRLNGTDDAGIFSFSFSFACFIQVIAIYSGRTFQVTESEKTINDLDFIYQKIICIIIMIIASLIFIIIKDYSTYKNFVIFLLILYKALDAFSEVLYGIFQKNNNLYQSGISLTIKSLITVSCFTIADYITQNLLYSIIIMVICDLIIIIVYDIKKFLQYKISLYKPKYNILKKLFFSGFAVFAFTLLIQFVLNIQKFAIDIYLSNSEQAIFGIIIMPATFMALCAQLIINPFLYGINKNLEQKKYKKFYSTIKRICLLTSLIGGIVLFVSLFLAIPILNFIYNIHLNDYYYMLMIVIFGSILYALSSILSNALIAIRKNNIQILIYIFISLSGFGACIIQVKYFGLLGACINFAIIMTVLLICYWIVFNKECKKLI